MIPTEVMLCSPIVSILRLEKNALAYLSEPWMTKEKRFYERPPGFKEKNQDFPKFWLIKGFFNRLLSNCDLIRTGIATSNICKKAHTQTHKHARTNTHTRTNIHLRTHYHTQTYTHTHTQTQTHLQTHHTHTDTDTRSHTHTNSHTLMNTLTNTLLHILT